MCAWMRNKPSIAVNPRDIADDAATPRDTLANAGGIAVASMMKRQNLHSVKGGVIVTLCGWCDHMLWLVVRGAWLRIEPLTFPKESTLR